MDQIPSDATKEGATPRELMNMLCGRNAAIHDDIINFAWVRPSAPAPSPPAPLPLGEGGRRPGEGVTKLTTLRIATCFSCSFVPDPHVTFLLIRVSSQTLSRDNTLRILSIQVYCLCNS